MTLTCKAWLSTVLRATRRALGGSRAASPLEVERAEWMFYLQYLRPGMVVIDAGAYVGELTELFSRFVGQRGEVHAFEAGAEAFRHLKARCELTGHENVIAHHSALADREGPIGLNVYDSDHLSWCSLADRPLREHGHDVRQVGTEEVLATTVDSYCERRQIRQVDLLKLDVEGAEYQVLMGAQHMLEKGRIRCCVFECGQTTFDMGNDPKAFSGYLERLGYRVRNVVRGDPLFPGCSGADTVRFSMHVAMRR